MNGGSYAGPGKKVVPLFIGVNVDATLDLGVVWDNMNIYVALSLIHI